MWVISKLSFTKILLKKSQLSVTSLFLCNSELIEIYMLIALIAIIYYECVISLLKSIISFKFKDNLIQILIKIAWLFYFYIYNFYEKYLKMWPWTTGFTIWLHKWNASLVYSGTNIKLFVKEQRDQGIQLTTYFFNTDKQMFTTNL